MPSPPTRPRRRFGQNFLVDRRAIDRIVQVIDPAADEAVVEIGPGRGALTERLLERTRRVAAIEIDRDLAARLDRRHAAAGLRMVVGNVLDTPWRELGSAAGLGPDDRFVLVGNLPYNLSKPIAMRVIDERSRVARAVLMFQREVADRLTARPGTRAYAPLTVLAHRHFDVERSFDLSPAAFRPRPKVRSTVTRWSPRVDRVTDDADETRFRAVLRACFAARRRTLANNVRAALAIGDDAARALLRDADLAPDARAETVDLDGFERLAARWPRGRDGPGD